MALLPNYVNFITGNIIDPNAVNTDLVQVYNLLGTGAGAATFSDANVAVGANINPAKISGTAAVLTGGGSQTITKVTNFGDPGVVNTIGSGATPTISLGGVLYANATAVTSAGVSTLMSYTLPANTLTTALRGLRITGWGRGTNDANAKTVAFEIGGAVVQAVVLATSVAAGWFIQCYVLRKSLNSQTTGSYTLNYNTNAGALGYGQIAATYLTETSTAVLSFNATVATTTGIIQDGMIVEAL